MLLLRCLSVLLALSLGQAVTAATYDFGSLGSVPSSGYSTTVDGITVTVTTPDGNNLGYYTDAAPGYGIGHTGCVFIICSDGLQQNETLTVSFSEDVTVNSITFAAWDGPDLAALSASNGNTLELDDDPTSGQQDTFDISSLGVLSSFTITNTKFTGLFTLRGLEVTAAVPLPSAGVLFSSVLLTLGGLARSRNRKK